MEASRMEVSIRNCCSLKKGSHAKFCYAEFCTLGRTNVHWDCMGLLESSLGFFEKAIFISFVSFDVFQVGEFYEAVGFDACVLVEYAGLNPFGGQRSDSIPRAGCPVVNLRQTLDDLTRNGFSVCIVEEVQGPAQARSRKDRFISGHAHPGNPYVFGLAGSNDDVNFPDPMPVVGISRSAKGYSMISILETMKTYSVEDCLTEEAVVTKLRTCQFHYLFLHSTLRRNSSGTCRWGEFGEGGLLWGECNNKSFEWFEGSPVDELLCKVRDIYGLDQETVFRNVTVPSEKRPRSIYLPTATQIGVIPTEGIPSLLKVLLPSNYTGLPVLYLRDLILNPPPHEIASSIQEACRLMSRVTCSIPEFTCTSPAKLVKLLESKEANHVEFCRIKHMVDEVVLLYENDQLYPILNFLMDPTWLATGLRLESEILVKECKLISTRISEMISLDGETDQKISSFRVIPAEFFEDMEYTWRGRVKRVHAELAFKEVDLAAKALSDAVSEDFEPIITRIKAVLAPLGGLRGEISYAREHEAIWFKGKNFMPLVSADSPGEEQMKQLKFALDAKGRKVGDDWYTTRKVDDALIRYHEANAAAKAEVLEILRGLSVELQAKINILVFSSTLLIIAKALFGHVCEGRRRNWVIPEIAEFSRSQDEELLDKRKMELIGLLPYWFDVAEGGGIKNNINMESIFLLTGPNGGGKSSLLRSICAAALLAMCGLMLPAESALVPHFDSVMLHMKSYDSPADGKSSFQIEMSELRSLVNGASSRSLVLIDEICRGTETAKGTCIAGSIVETLDSIGCLGVVSTHLHGIFDLPLTTKNVVNKAMRAEKVNGRIRPTWQLGDGVCRESLAFETALMEGLPDAIVERAGELYLSAKKAENQSQRGQMVDLEVNALSSVEWVISSQETLFEKVEKAVTEICRQKLIDLQVSCLYIGAREQPPPLTTGSSSVYVLFRPDERLYVGQSDDLAGRVRSHRGEEGFQQATFLYLLLPGKSLATQLETLLINQLPRLGFRLANVADGKHRHFGTLNLSLDTLTLQP
ncbi:MUTL protein homolog 1 isoform X2 [Wolffia australiana]